jgi:hypothetical protein
VSRVNKRIVFAGIGRDVEPYVSLVLGNVERIGNEFENWTAVFVENDSKDATKALLRAWIDNTRRDAGPRGRLIELDGVDAFHPTRFRRLAHLRNCYLKEIAVSAFKSFDYLAVLDLDATNACSWSLESFVAAISFLEARDDAVAAFANAVPVYYDIWALREKNWCPRDCWREVDAAKAAMGFDAAVQKYVFARQIVIDPERDPIEVDSAFGGLGIYKLARALQARYVGIDEDGSDICEHVIFNRRIRQAGGRLFIFPSLVNLASPQHTSLGSTQRGAPTL